MCPAFDETREQRSVYFRAEQQLHDSLTTAKDSVSDSNLIRLLVHRASSCHVWFYSSRINSYFELFKLCSGPSGPRRVQNKAAMAKRDYLVEAAKQIRMALDSEVNEDYEAAFSYYKNGVDLLLNGVQCKRKTLLQVLQAVCYCKWGITRGVSSQDM